MRTYISVYAFPLRAISAIPRDSERFGRTRHPRTRGQTAREGGNRMSTKGESHRNASHFYSMCPHLYTQTAARNPALAGGLPKAR